MSAIAVLASATAILTPAFGTMGVAWAAVIADLVWAGLLAFQTHRHASYRGDLLAVLRN